MKSESWLVIQLGAALLLLGLLCFFATPSYEKGAWYIIVAFYGAFNNVIGYKFGRSMPQQASDPKVGQTSESTTKTSAEPLPPA